MKPSVFIIYGPPGSGKGTQADELAQHFNVEHFDTGKVIQKIINDPEKLKDPIIQEQKKNFETGLLCDPPWVAELVINEIKSLYKRGQGIVLSGSPRTLPEARELIPVLMDLYGKENVYIIKIVIKPETSIFRNSHRKICEKINNCPICGGRLTDRGALDTPEVIKIRIKEYQERTEPIYEFLKENNIAIEEIDGEPAPDIVTKNILKAIK
jgi:adenylate kinase